MFGSLFKIVTKTKEVVIDHTPDIQRVNCLNLVPATTQVRRPHCDMGDGREGDCPIFLKKKEKCRLHDPKYVPLCKEEILAKVRTKQQDNEYIENCLNVEICPGCGHDLVIGSWNGGSEFTNGFCHICQKTYIID